MSIKWWMWNIHTMEYYPAVESNKALVPAAIWINLKNNYAKWNKPDKKGHIYELSRLGISIDLEGCPGGTSGKEPPANGGDIRDTSSIPGWGWSPGGGHGNPLQYSCLENPMDRGAWRATVHGVAKRWTQMKQLSSYTQTWKLDTSGCQKLGAGERGGIASGFP